MRLIAGCPIAHRAWALPLWFRYLAAQTRRPDHLLFIHSGQWKDQTWRALERNARHHGFDIEIQHDPTPAHQRHDNDRFRTLARLRNRLLTNAEEAGAELLLSLDSDIMLENPRTIEHLEELVVDEGFDVAAPVTFFHPEAWRTDLDDVRFWAYNAGWWAPGGALDDPQRQWRRPGPEAITWGDAITIHIPMGVWLGNQRALACRYQWHESGEDLGFAQDLDRHGLSAIWDTSLRARHIWCEQNLRELAVAA